MRVFLLNKVWPKHTSVYHYVCNIIIVQYKLYLSTAVDSSDWSNRRGKTSPLAHHLTGTRHVTLYADNSGAKVFKCFCQISYILQDKNTYWIIYLSQR